MDVKMFTCGPSVYRRPHIGNHRTFLFEDLLQRYLEYLGYNVTRLITLTDIEDKAIIEADREAISVEELAARNSDQFSRDAQLLRMRTPTYSACMMACSSTAVEEAATLIKRLLEKGYAYYYTYRGRRNIYYAPLKFTEFGKLSKLNMKDWPQKKRRFHRDTYPGTPWNKGDFILWHGYKQGDSVYWDTAIGRGRPAWNIQDAATITKYLGFTADVACGGIDNLTRHHDYTIAIVEGTSGEEFAHYWFHGEHLYVDGEKMSKSRRNVYYPSDLITMGYDGEDIRFSLIYGHYRDRLNFTLERLQKLSLKLKTFKKMVLGLERAKSARSMENASRLVDRILESFEKHMNDDLDVKAAFDALFTIMTRLDSLRKQGRLSATHSQIAVANLKKVDCVLQIIF